MATMSGEVFQSWTADRAKGLDAIMLAPTRDLVAELNRQARQHRLAGATTTGQPTVQLADGNEATTGDVVLTRRNDRRLRQSATRLGQERGPVDRARRPRRPGRCVPNTPRPGEW